jgi:NMD protein affecting ribosome stability and mRNA decay
LAAKDNQIHLGNVDASIHKDVGLDLYSGKKVQARLVAGSISDDIMVDMIMIINLVH